MGKGGAGREKRKGGSRYDPQGQAVGRGCGILTSITSLL